MGEASGLTHAHAPGMRGGRAPPLKEYFGVSDVTGVGARCRARERVTLSPAPLPPPLRGERPTGLIRGRPVMVVTEENVRKIEKLVLADRRIKLWQIAEELQISKERVEEIIHEYMNMRKISARWVPKILTPFDKQRRLQTSMDFLELVGDNIDKICDRIVTVDETWVRQYHPESKQEFMQWKKRRKTAEEIQGSKVGIEAYGDNFWIVKSYRSDVGSYRAGDVLQDNASVHMALVSRQALKDTGFSEIDHHPTAQI
ncbi:Putative uncharacterized protein FLJ37770 [Eumeta japonica]|uniref:Histone-lysine N-methyltransferase SETMAR n=1 Tax=Eumeta variegata TaxID=151549 RepID=A0A4C1ZAH1_EUMVA|nr:Putative uncharacterized protein FLJ37770 [Eumeta japonica]